ncbi:unnamed protein product, partial [Ectocarpus sp. 8 AP-2014]
MCKWTLLPWTGDTAPDRLFFRSSQVFQGRDDLPMSPSLTITLGTEFSLVGVAYHLPLGGGSRNHFVTQMRSRGRWHKYDCLQGGPTTSSDDFDPTWHESHPYMLVYLRTSMCIATPPAYHEPSSPS